MTHFNTVLGQMLEILPRHKFQAIVGRHGGDRYVKTFPCWSQLVCMLFVQLSGRRSLRDLVRSLEIHGKHYYHLGLKPCKRNTLAHANKERSWEIYRDTFMLLLDRCVKPLAPGHGFRFKNKLFALDSTTIALCLSLFGWAKFRKSKGGVKVHAKLDLSGHIPCFAFVTEANVSDVKAAKTMSFEPGSITVVDRAYTDYAWRWELETNGCFFVIRQKKNAEYKVVKRRRARRGGGVTSDADIILTSKKGEAYPKRLRRIRFVNPEDGRAYVFLTNMFHLSASTIADLYKSRWQIELFFKEIKQNLKIKKFLGTSKNALQIQIWTAMIAYLLAAYLKCKSRCRISVGDILQLLQLNLFDRRPVEGLLHRPDAPPVNRNVSPQLELALL